MPALPPELRDHLLSVSALEPELLDRLADELLACFDEDLAGFVRRRHRELHARGFCNDDIWPRIQAEIRSRPFRAEALSLRQIRRLVYG